MVTCRCKCAVLAVTVVWLGLACRLVSAEESEAKSARDSYLMALRNSQQINGNKGSGGFVRIAREDYSSVPSTSYEYSLGPSATAYGAPPAGSYGAPPKPVYGPPKPAYGPPAPVYGPPTAMAATAPASHGMPYLSPESWLLSKLKFKLSWFTLAKILLKIVIFKKIVKFIALLCLLFFIPTLKPSESDNGDHHHNDSGEEYRRRRSYDPKYDYENRLHEVTRFAMKAMEAFTIDNEIYCPEENLLSCRAKRMFDVIDEEYPLASIVKLFVPYSHTVFRLNSKGHRTEELDSNDQDQDSSGTSDNSLDRPSASSSNEGGERDD